MWYTTRQEGFDDPRHSKRAPCLNVNIFTRGLLRAGFTLQLLSFTMMIAFNWAFGGSGIFSYDLSTMDEEERANDTFRVFIAIFSLFYLLGSFYILLFQALMSDDAAWARGFRAGSKILRLAAFFDVISSVMQFIFFLYVAKFYSAKWYDHFNAGGSECVFLAYIRCMHAICFVLYGISTYLLEVYHDEGAGDLHAYINCAFLLTAGIFEFSLIFFQISSTASGLIWASLFVVTTWCYFFEPEVNHASPLLDETELTNDVEQQVEKFTRVNPFEVSQELTSLPPQ